MPPGLAVLGRELPHVTVVNRPGQASQSGHIPGGRPAGHLSAGLACDAAVPQTAGQFISRPPTRRGWCRAG